MSHQDIPRAHFYMIRHGQTEANEARLMAGKLDSPLTALGRRQAASVHDVLNNLEVKPRAIVHSHLSRARDTAHILNGALNIPLHEDPDFAEIDAGEWEGAPYDICRPLFDGWVNAPQGEKYQDFFERVKRAKIKALTSHASPVMIVCHGGVMRAVGELFGIPTPGRFENAHLYEFLPHRRNDTFPWDVFHYRYDETDRILKREESNLYHQATKDILS